MTATDGLSCSENGISSKPNNAMSCCRPRSCSAATAPIVMRSCAAKIAANTGHIADQEQAPGQHLDDRQALAYMRDVLDELAEASGSRGDLVTGKAACVIACNACKMLGWIGCRPTRHAADCES
jgi:hypothetical protein